MCTLLNLATGYQFFFLDILKRNILQVSDILEKLAPSGEKWNNNQCTVMGLKHSHDRNNNQELTLVSMASVHILQFQTRKVGQFQTFLTVQQKRKHTGVQLYSQSKSELLRLGERRSVVDSCLIQTKVSITFLHRVCVGVGDALEVGLLEHIIKFCKS